MTFLQTNPSQPFGSRPGTRRLRLEDLSIPVPQARHIQRFQAAYEQLHGKALSRDEAADYLYRILVVTRYRQLTRPAGTQPTFPSPDNPIQPPAYAPDRAAETPHPPNQPGD